MGVVSSVVVGQGAAVLLPAGAEPAEARAAFAQPATLALVTIVQYAAMAVVAIATCRIAVRRPREALALLPMRDRTHVIDGAIAGLATLGVAAGVGALLLETFPGWDTGGLEQLGEAFTTGPLGPRLALAVAVTVGAPIAEEFVFRGVLWDLLKRRMSERAVFVTTSLVFAAWHLSPFHALTLVPTALLFGWLRLKTGSLVPSMVAHAVNNGMGAALLLTAGADTEAEFQLLPFLFAAALYLGVVLAARRGGVDPSTRAP